MKRVAIYARVSKDKNEQNPEIQLSQLREFARYRGYSVTREYIDKVTGRISARKNLTSYDALLSDAEQGLFDIVLVWKYDRFARSLVHLVLALQKFQSLGIDFISLTQNIDTTTANGRLFFHIIASFAEFERELISERTKAGLQFAKEQGKRLGPLVQIPGEEIKALVDFWISGATLDAMELAFCRPRATIYSVVSRTVCRLKCRHGKYRCNSCRSASNDPTTKRKVRPPEQAQSGLQGHDGRRARPLLAHARR